MSQKPEHFADPLPPARFDAVHRAVLAGLLGNVGMKNDAHEYTGARGTKFSIFPGSGLFRNKPKWVMAAELVETTKLYARTAANIKPEWVERVADHLVKKTYTDPRWQPERGHVVASERVTLYGLPLVAQRTVHYGPINPKESREIFIRAALVDQDWRTDAPFFRHNRRLIEEVQSMEAKARRRDILVDPKTVYDFYDAKVPAGVYNGPLFEKWRREAERHQPKLLHMTRRDLMRHAADDVTAEQFPDVIPVNGVPLNLEYDLDPGGPMDGVTLVVPLAILNQLPVHRFDWLIPGLLREKIEELIRSLPKPIRVQFVPVTDTATAAAAQLKASFAPLVDTLADWLGKRAGATVPRSQFDLSAIPPYLAMNFRVIDEKGKTLATGRDLEAIRRQLGVAARQSFAAMPRTSFTKENLTRWDFGDLPPNVEVKRDGLTFLGYPALVDRESSVSLDLLDSPEAARDAMRFGIRRLFMVQLKDEFKHLERTLPGLGAMGLNYATLGNSADLRGDLLLAIADRALNAATTSVGSALADGTPAGAMFATTSDIRLQSDFVRIAEQGWRNLQSAAKEVAAVIGEILAEYQPLHRRLGEPFAPLLHPGVRDMREQLAHLVYKGFVARIPWQHLQHVPRYLQAINVRLKKLTNAGLARDEAQAYVVTPYWKHYLVRLEKHRKDGTKDPELMTFRWMIEELRVSLFAQELKTAYPVSPQRLDRQWELVKP